MEQPVYMIPIVTSEEIADAHRYDVQDEGVFIDDLILGSQALLYNAGAFNPDNPMMKTAIHLIVGHWLENRDGMGFDYKDTSKLPYSIQGLINSLRFWGDDYA